MAELPEDYNTRPAVAASPEGYVATWIRDNQNAVFARPIAASGAPANSEKRIDTQDGSTYFPETMALHPGPNGFLATWVGHGPGASSDYRFRPLNLLGEPQGEHELHVELRGQLQEYKLAARSEHDGYLLIYSNRTSPENNWSLRQMRMSFEGTLDPASDTAILSPPLSRSMNWLAAASGYDGRAVVAWVEQDETNTYPQEVHVASIKNGKPIWSTAFPKAYESVVHPNVAMLPDGRVFVAWTAGLSPDRLETAWVGADGTPGSIVRLDDHATNATRPSIAYSPKGELMVVWEGLGGGIRGRRFASNGTLVDTENIVLIRPPSRADYPAVAAGTDGSFLLVYREHAPSIAIRYQLLPPGFRKNPF